MLFRYHEEHCCGLKIAAEDYKNEITLGHQVQSYNPPIQKTYEPLPEDIEAFFSGDIADLVSKKLPGKHHSFFNKLFYFPKNPGLLFLNYFQDTRTQNSAT